MKNKYQWENIFYRVSFILKRELFSFLLFFIYGCTDLIFYDLFLLFLSFSLLLKLWENLFLFFFLFILFCFDEKSLCFLSDEWTSSFDTISNKQLFSLSQQTHTLSLQMSPVLFFITFNHQKMIINKNKIIINKRNWKFAALF